MDDNFKKLVRKLVDISDTATSHQKDASELFKDLSTIQVALVEFVSAVAVMESAAVTDARAFLIDQLGWLKSHATDLHNSVTRIENAVDTVLTTIQNGEV